MDDGELRVGLLRERRRVVEGIHRAIREIDGADDAPEENRRRLARVRTDETAQRLFPLPDTYAATSLTADTCSTVTVESYHAAIASAWSSARFE